MASNPYQNFPKSLRPIAERLHQILLGIEPDFEVKPAWGGIGYKQGSNYSCIVHAQKDHVQMMIMRGIMLKDKQNKLQGRGINTRHLKFFTLEDIDAQYIQDLIKQQLKLYADGLKWE